MKNLIKSFTLVVRPDDKSRQIAESIREINSSLGSPLVESDDGDLVIAIGGDGTFIDAVTKMNFSKEKIFTGVHTGTLGFLQDLSEKDIFSLIRYFRYEEEITVRKVYVAMINVYKKDGSFESFYALNEVPPKVTVKVDSLTALSFNGEAAEITTSISELVQSNTTTNDYLKKQFQNRNSSIGKPVKLVVDDGNIYKIVRNEEIINTVAD